ncbi:hypothetical protein EGW08_014173 [Elysia chlorotica]|uniref:Uncharacterized protein n=1 Tax=Elysia chlorotica TaxID=188477 RepID=A0A3S1B7T6_ELYCH|nr:hypothetical protein EGW08_014173 [Elysia chlorotica]
MHSSGDCMSEVRAVNCAVREVRRASETAAQPSSATAVATATSTIMALTGSPEMPSERRKSYHSYNSKSSSTKSSSNNTSSTNQSGGGGGNMSRLDRECLTFTQQLQQCSMGKNRSRPISRVLSPVSEPQSPEAIRSPSSSQPPPLPSHPPPPALTSSPAARLGPGADSTEGYCEIHTGLGVQIISSSRKTTTTAPVVSSENALSPPPPPLPPKGPGLSLNRTHAVLAPSNSAPGGTSSMQVKPERRVSATINIITNPHADMMSSVEEPVWQRNPTHPASSSSVSTTSSNNLQPSNGSYVKNYHNHSIHLTQQQAHQQQNQLCHNGSNNGNANHNNFLTACSSSSSSSGSHLDVWSHNHHHHHQHSPHQPHHSQQQQTHSSTGSSPSRIIMGQSSLSNKSPERRWKRNGIVTNPKAMHTSSTSNNNGNSYARSMSNSSNSSNSNSIPQQFHRFSGGTTPNTSATLISPTSPTSNGHARRASFSPTTSPTNGVGPQSPRRASDVNPKSSRPDGKAVDHIQGSCGKGTPLVGQPALYQLDYVQQPGVKPVRPNGLPIKKVNSPRNPILLIVTGYMTEDHVRWFEVFHYLYNEIATCIEKIKQHIASA